MSRPRTIVLCFDGTTNDYDGENTNVIKFFSLLKKDDDQKQLIYYQAGIGTFFSPGVVNPLFEWSERIMDEAIAWSLDAHVMDGYRYLMENYCIGDKICLFGFSRGAYTARALAGMLYKVGLLVRDNNEQVIFAYKLYKRTDDEGITLSAGFKQTFSQSVKIDFVGVWDTVASVGIVAGRTLPFVDSNISITTFRQALSLDEHRAKFQPNLYRRPAPTAARQDSEHASTTVNASLRQKRRSLINYLKGKGRSDSAAKDEEAADDSAPCAPDMAASPTDVLEVWFSGCHADIGGGNDADSVNNSLSGITLRWMVREVMASQCRILFDDEALARYSIPTTISSPPPCETAADEVDAVQPMHDALQVTPMWWMLEVVPLPYSWQDENRVWRTGYGWHLGRGRIIRDPHPKFHITVKERMTTASLKYTPRATWTKGTETYVE